MLKLNKLLGLTDELNKNLLVLTVRLLN